MFSLTLVIANKTHTKPSTGSMPYPSRKRKPDTSHALSLAPCKSARRKRPGSHQNTFTLTHDGEDEMSKRPKKLLDRACTELVEVSATRSGSSTTLSAPQRPELVEGKKLTSAGSTAIFSTTTNAIPRTWALRKWAPALVSHTAAHLTAASAAPLPSAPSFFSSHRRPDSWGR
jgi:hypothetical protein